MIDFMKARYRAGNLCVVGAGCLEHDELVGLVQEALGGVSGAASADDRVAPVIRRHIDVARRDLEQTHICLGVDGLPQNHADRYGIYVLNTILGGNMSSRLFQRIRENLGLAYSVYSYHHNHSDSGSFIVYAGTSADDAPLVVRSILDEMSSLRNSAVSIEELQGAKDYLKGSMLLAMESMDNRMTRLAKNELFLRNVGICVEESRAMIDAVTLDLVQYLAESLFVNETLNLQVAGRVNRADFPDVDLVLG
jgi:predicted Zn-dependent peptidase